MRPCKAAQCFFLLSLLAARPAAAQRGARSAPSLQIDVQVRNPDGSIGPRGIHVVLESPEGGVYDDCVTADGGKCTFLPRDTGVYTVKIAGGGYAGVFERIELVNNHRGFATLTLRKTDNSAGMTPAKDAPSAEMSVTDYRIPETARQEFAKGEADLRGKKLGDSVKHFQKAVKIYDHYPQAYRMLGEAYLEQQDWKKSEEALKKSITLDPNLAAAYMDLGAVYNQQKDYPQAETALKKGLELSPDATAAKYELAKTYWATNRWQEAAPYAQAVVKEVPALAGAHVLYANILLRQRDGVGALREYKEYLRLEPGGPMATQVRAEVEKLEKALGK
jgi:predicted Zn-dependent protease